MRSRCGSYQRRANSSSEGQPAVPAPSCLAVATNDNHFEFQNNPKSCARQVAAILFMAKRLTFVKPNGTPCTTRSGEKANSGAPPVLVAFGDCDARRLQQFAAAYGGVLVEKWQLF